MASTSESQQALWIAQKAKESARVGDLAAAAKYLREASNIAPDLPQIQEAWEQLRRKEEDGSELLNAFTIWVKSKDEKDGERAMGILRSCDLRPKEAEQAMEILSEFKGEDDLLDQVTGELLLNVGAQTCLVNAVREQPTRTYYDLFERGDDSIDGLLKVLLTRVVWPDDKAFRIGHRDCFMLSLAMMMEEALEHPERAMKVVAQLLAHFAHHLKGIIDADSFDVILTSLDIRLPTRLRSQATIASIKLFELAPDTASEMIAKFVTNRVERAETNDLIVAFSAATAIFPVAVTAAAALFLTEGFIDSLVPITQSKKSPSLENATLELLSAACVDKNCRDAINLHCRKWLEDLVAESREKRRANLAALILVKVGENPAPSDGLNIITPAKVDQSDLIASFKSMVIGGDASSKRDSVEGLAYASLKPKIREDLSKSPKFMRKLIETVRDSSSVTNVVYGGLTILVNITTYLPIQSEEEKRMAQLKSYANIQKPAEPDKLLDDASVSARCKRVLEAGVVPLLVSVCKNNTPSVLSQIALLLLNLSTSKDSKSRGVMAQQGAVKLLVQIWEQITAAETSLTDDKMPYLHTTLQTAAQALSRLLISINPCHVFNASLPGISAIRPLVSQISRTESSTWQLNAFEALLALTNLASLDREVQDHIIRQAFDAIVDDLLLSSNTMIRRAATELVCNLMASPACIQNFVDSSNPRSKHRLHLLLAMTDIEDAATRSAAGGALAMLLSVDIAVRELLKQEKGIEFLLGLCRDEEDSIRHRGVVCLRCVCDVPEGLELARKKGAIETLRSVARETRSPEVLAVGVETLKILLQQE